MAVCVGATDFIGGGTGALDSYDGASFSAGDAAMVYKNGQCIPYIFVSSAEAENSPWFIRPDTNGTGVGWRAVEDSNLNIIRANLTLYLASTGSDTANTGMTSGSPWKTLNKAIDWLGDKVIMPDATVTISVNSSSIAHTGIVEIDGPQYRRVVIDGNGSTNSTLDWSAAGTGGIKINNNTSLGDIKDIKLLGDGTNGNGILVDNVSSIYSSGDLLIDSFDIGLFVDNGSYAIAGGVISSKNNNSDGCRVFNTSASKLQSCVFDNNGSHGLYCANGGSCNASSSTSTNNTSNGYYSQFNSWIKANTTTVSGNGTNYSPAKTTANDPTFGNFGSWIYG